MQGNSWRFECSVPDPQRPGHIREYSATASDPLGAVQAVLQKLENASRVTPLERRTVANGYGVVNQKVQGLAFPFGLALRELCPHFHITGHRLRKSTKFSRRTHAPVPSLNLDGR
jgi:hypothetical protein